MEHVGFDPNQVHISVHTAAYNHVKETQISKSKQVENATSEFHTYRIDWTPDYIHGFIDGEKIFEFLKESSNSEVWPFDKKFHLLLNIAVGGNWGGIQGIDDSAFPATMEIDYIRAYALKE
jgi:beta-glucanase (GH16 family)